MGKKNLDEFCPKSVLANKMTKIAGADDERHRYWINRNQPLEIRYCVTYIFRTVPFADNQWLRDVPILMAHSQTYKAIKLIHTFVSSARSLIKNALFDSYRRGRFISRYLNRFIYRCSRFKLILAVAFTRRVGSWFRWQHSIFKFIFYKVLLNSQCWYSIRKKIMQKITII